MAAPIVDNYSPPNGSNLSGSTAPIFFDVSDPDGELISSIFIWCDPGDGRAEVIYANGEFQDQFTALSHQSNIVHGHRFEVRRFGGWLGNVTIHTDPMNLDESISSWQKYTVSYADLTAAALTDNASLFSLLARGEFEEVMVKHTTAFAGTGITAVSITIGIDGDQARYAGAFDVFQSVGDTVALHTIVEDFESFADDVSVKLFATAVGANLSELTAGSVDIYVKKSRLPS